MISSVPLRLRAFANSNATTIQNLLGFLPAPSVYGLMTKYLALPIKILRIHERAGLLLIGLFPWVGLLFLTTAVILKRKEKKNLPQELQQVNQITNHN